MVFRVHTHNKARKPSPHSTIWLTLPLSALLSLHTTHLDLNATPQISTVTASQCSSACIYIQKLIISCVKCFYRNILRRYQCLFEFSNLSVSIGGLKKKTVDLFHGFIQQWLRLLETTNQLTHSYCAHRPWGCMFCKTDLKEARIFTSAVMWC